ncbi:hypothetical protein E4U36_003926 [Claviceps purpurea]|nr:hypothetical protein E4U36_003926 [Claviceps purpurea]
MTKSSPPRCKTGNQLVGTQNNSLRNRMILTVKLETICGRIDKRPEFACPHLQELPGAQPAQAALEPPGIRQWGAKWVLVVDGIREVHRAEPSIAT